MCDRQPKDAGDGLDVIEHCGNKLQFLCAVLSQRGTIEFHLGDTEAAGLFWFVEDIAVDLEAAQAVIRASLTGGQA